MDYLDHTSVNQASAINTPRISDPNEVCVSYGVVDVDKQHQALDDKAVNTNGSVHHDMQQPMGAGASSYSAPVSQQQQVTQQQYYQTGQQPVQATTLPNNLQGAHSNNMGHPQSMPQGSIPLLTQV